MSSVLKVEMDRWTFPVALRTSTVLVDQMCSKFAGEDSFSAGRVLNLV
jgi:hypothetical protein